MAKSKITTSSSKSFAQGGKGHMFGKQNADTQASATTGKKTSGTGGKGGKGHMFGKGSAKPMPSGQTGKSGN
jgi:hypothetical protein